MPTNFPFSTIGRRLTPSLNIVSKLLHISMSGAPVCRGRDMRLRTGNLSRVSPRRAARVTSRSVMIPTGFCLSVITTLPMSNLTISRIASSTRSVMSIVTMLVVMISDRSARSALFMQTDQLRAVGCIIEELTITNNENKSGNRHVDFGTKCQRNTRMMTGSGLEVASSLDIYYIRCCVSGRELYVSSLV